MESGFGSVGFSPLKLGAEQSIDWRSTEHLSKVMGERTVSIAVTPNG